MKSLPDYEIKYLNTFPYPPTRRLATLRAKGWSLSVLGKALDPPRSKATIHNWTANEEIFDFTEPIPTPQKAPIPAHPLAPLVPLETIPELRRLVPLAQRYRSRTPKNSIYAESNEKLTELAVSLYLRGIPVSAIAKAAQVSNRAMYRRVNKGLGKHHND